MEIPTVASKLWAPYMLKPFLLPWKMHILKLYRYLAPKQPFTMSIVFYLQTSQHSHLKIATLTDKLELQDVLMTFLALVASNEGPPPSLWKVMILMNAQASNRIFMVHVRQSVKDFTEVVYCTYFTIALLTGLIPVSHSHINPFMPNGFSHPYQLDEFISYFRVVRWYFLFSFKF